MARRILHEIKLDKIAAVDRPCQEGAKATIMKRAGAEPGSNPDEGEIMSAALKKALGLAETATDAEVEAAVAKLATDNATAQAQIADLAKMATMSDATREHYNSLEKAAKGSGKEFLDMDEAERKKTVEKLAAGDETIVVEGQTISKRAVGEPMFNVLKAQAERIAKNEADIKRANEATANAEFAKRATTEFAHLAGSAEERASVLKFLAGAPEEVRKAADAIFTAAEGLAKTAFAKLGAQGGEAGDANDELEKMVKKAMDADPKLTKAKAMDQVLQTPEGAALYEKTVSPAAAQ